MKSDAGKSLKGCLRIITYKFEEGGGNIPFSNTFISYVLEGLGRMMMI
jgi:hypothetical protein